MSGSVSGRTDGLDLELESLLMADEDDQESRLSLVASSSVAHPAVRRALSSTATNVTAEGRPGARFHAGCSVVDEIERLATTRATRVFGAKYVNVQPHSATTANQLVLFSLLKPGDRILSMDPDSGGHLSHGHPSSVSGQMFEVAHYGRGERGIIDFDELRSIAQRLRPALIICGGSSYSRTIDFAAFREIADSVGALLLADVSHIAGLVAAGLHPSPLPHAHVTTTCTHKQLYGPRGGLIMSGDDAFHLRSPSGRELAEVLDRAVFPFFQGAPMMNAIAAKAAALGFCEQPAFSVLARQIADRGADLAKAMQDRGYSVVTGGTDNHIVMIDLRKSDITGAEAEVALERCGIIVNRNRVPGDRRPPRTTSGLRLGTNTIALRRLTYEDVGGIADQVDLILTALTDSTDRLLPQPLVSNVRRWVAALCLARPITWA